MLNNKSAVIYGAAGNLGPGIARHFAREGARVFLVGRTRATLDALAAEIGPRAHVAVVDALDPRAVRAHLDAIVAEHGSIDISFNLIARGDVQGAPLLDMSADDFMAPITTGTRTQFITAQAARRMQPGG